MICSWVLNKKLLTKETLFIEVSEPKMQSHSPSQCALFRFACTKRKANNAEQNNPHRIAHETMVVAVVALDHLYIIVALFRKPDENRRKVEERDAKKMKRKMRSARQKEKLTSYGRENFLTKLLAPMNFLPDTTTAAAVAECNFPWNFSRAKKRNKNKRKKNKLRAIQFEWEMSFVYATRIKQQQEWKWWW